MTESMESNNMRTSYGVRRKFGSIRAQTPRTGDAMRRGRNPLKSKDATERLLAHMFVENTGRHILDSGDAYGRHWQENQKNAPWNKPYLGVTEWGYSINAYKYLLRRDELVRSRLAANVERKFYNWVEREDESPYSCDVMRQFMRLRKGEGALLGNTYNSEYGLSNLSQVLQWGEWYDRGVEAQFILLQIHQGCDVRGGYTAPRVFELHSDYFDTGEFTLYCSECQWDEAESCVNTADPETGKVPKEALQPWQRNHFNPLADEPPTLKMVDDRRGYEYDWMYGIILDEEHNRILCGKCKAEGRGDKEIII